MPIPKKIVITVDLDNPAESKTELKRIMRQLRRIIREMARLSEQKSEAKK